MGHNIYAACINFFAELYPMASILIQINICFLLIFISCPAVWITKINKCISEIFIFYFIYIPFIQRFAVVGDTSRAGSYLPHLIFLLISHMV